MSRYTADKLAMGVSGVGMALCLLAGLCLLAYSLSFPSEWLVAIALTILILNGILLYLCVKHAS